MEKLNDLKETLQQKFQKLSECKDVEFVKNLYNEETHYFLTENSIGWPSEIMLPLPKEEWPKNFRDLEKRYESQMKWPNWSMYLYTMDIFCPPFIPDSLFYLGYAMYQDKLFCCPFFVVLKMTEQTINDKKMTIPVEFVIDPLASMTGITPDCYVGASIDKRYVEEWFFSRGKTGDPLENYVEQKNKKEHEERLYKSYLEGYSLQMAYEPGWFPQQLIDFAQKERLYIPEQKRTDTSLHDDGLEIFGDENTENKKSVTNPVENKKSKRLFLLRHANYNYTGRDDDPHISDQGKQQARNLSDKIKANLNGNDEDITIWTSSANRAKETALIIKEDFPNAEFVEYEKLWSDNDHPYDFKWFKQQLEDFRGKTLIVISHLEYVQQFPELLNFPENDASYARGVLIENNEKCTNFG